MKALPKGQYIKHYRYGFGVITDSTDEGTSIDFELHGSKNFVTSLLVVELSPLTPPKQFRDKWIQTVPANRPLRKMAARTRTPKYERPPAPEPAEESA